MVEILKITVSFGHIIRELSVDVFVEGLRLEIMKQLSESSTHETFTECLKLGHLGGGGIATEISPQGHVNVFERSGREFYGPNVNRR